MLDFFRVDLDFRTYMNLYLCWLFFRRRGGVFAGRGVLSVYASSRDIYQVFIKAGQIYIVTHIHYVE